VDLIKVSKADVYGAGARTEKVGDSLQEIMRKQLYYDVSSMTIEKPKKLTEKMM